MKRKFIALFLLTASIAVISCNKSDDNTPQNTAVNDSLITKIHQGLIPGEDTTFVIRYDANHRVDTLFETYDESTTSMVITYDENGNPDMLTENYDGYSDNTSIKFNANKQLIETYNAGQKDRRTFEYTNGVLSRKSFYTQTNTNSPTLNLWRYFIYEFTKGNITSIKEYDALNTLVEETTFTYSDEPNLFKNISLFNFNGMLGTFDIATVDFYFNKNLPATSTTGTNVCTYTYTHNDKKQLTKVVSSDSYQTLTRELSY